MKKALLVDIISSLYVLLFFYTGISKLREYEYFLATLQKSPVTNSNAHFFAMAVPAIEIIIAFALLIPFFVQATRLRTWGLYSGAILMALFTGYVWYILREYPNHLPCSCGGIIQKMNWHQHLYFNSAFTLLGILACWMNKRLSTEAPGILAVS